MKKTVMRHALLAAALILTLGACRKNGAAPAAAVKAAASPERPAVQLVTDATGIDDKSFNAATWRGILEYYGDTWANPTGRGKYYDFTICQSQDTFVSALKLISDQGYDLVLATGFSFADAVGEVAAQYSGQKFVIVDVDWVNLPNVLNFVFAEEQASYLVGLAAALKAQEDHIANPKFGFIGGVPGATITKFEMGYIQGIKAIFPDAAILDYYTNDWGKPDLAKTQAKNWYDNGVYMIYSAAGGSGNGTIAQAKEYRIQGKNVWAIGVDSDQYEDGIYSGTDSAVYTSMIKKVETAVVLALKAVETGAFKGEVITLDMADGGVDYAATNPAMSGAVKASLEAAKKEIIAGSITVLGTYRAARAAGIASAGLGALDD